MKRFTWSLVGTLFLFLSVVSAQNNNGQRFTEEKVNQIEQNLIQSLESNIPGVRLSAAKTVWDLKTIVPQYSFSHRTVIALMRIMKDEEANDQSRILAAIALSQLNSEVGNYAIKMETRFSGSESVKHICSWLAYNRAVEERVARAGKLATSKEIAIK